MDDFTINFFISHSHADTEWAEWIAQILEEKGYSTFVDVREIKAGMEWAKELERAITRSQYLIVLLSGDYLYDQYTQWLRHSFLNGSRSGFYLVDGKVNFKEIRIQPIIVGENYERALRTIQSLNVAEIYPPKNLIGLNEEEAYKAIMAIVDKLPNLSPNHSKAQRGSHFDHNFPGLEEFDTLNKVLERLEHTREQGRRQIRQWRLFDSFMLVLGIIIVFIGITSTLIMRNTTVGIITLVIGNLLILITCLFIKQLIETEKHLERYSSNKYLEIERISRAIYLVAKERGEEQNDLRKRFVSQLLGNPF
jgi:TIR domain